MNCPGPWIQQIQGDATGMPGVPRTVDVNLFLEMKLGEKSERVRWVQNRLGNLTPDGDFGPMTETAVKAFQTRKSLPDTGSIDVRSFAALCA
jgi:peptidoglycan hydrolase-like protein with peptidoglycan-binding domain